MMIDQCIFDVYQRDKKVFLPDFGAIIYSEFNDSIDFNDLLTFDDGKVVEEIQKQESLSEEEARKALEEYIEEIKNTLGKGKLHYIGGIGYLSKDENGSYFIEKSQPSDEASSKKSPTKAKSKSSKKKSESTTDQKDKTKVNKEETAAPTVEEIPEPLPADDNVDNDISSKSEDSLLTHTEDEIEKPIITGEETEYEIEEGDTFNSFSTDEDVYNEYEEQENTAKKDNSPKKVLWIAIFVIILSVGGFYLYKVFLGPQSGDNKELLTSSEKSTSENDASPSESSPEQADNASAVPSSFESGKDKLKALSNNSENSARDEGANINDDEQKTFSLILGSFKVESNADKYRQRLQARGIDVEKFRGLNNFFFVGIEKIEGKSNAVRRLEEFKRKDPSAWIYNNALLL